MHALKIPVAGFAGALLTASMFWALWSLVETSFDAGERIEAPRIEFTRIRPDTEIVDRRQERIVRETPPPTLETPRLALTTGGVDNRVAQLAPALNTRGASTRMAMTAGSDRDVIPLVRINPEYPPSAIRRELEGWVQVQFTITASGMVKDAMVVDAEPDDIFDDAALKAIARWRYNPKVENGAPVERAGVQTRIVFQLEQ
jgi:periplasmic protein TonB